MFDFSTITLQVLTTVCHHVCIPASLIIFLCWLYIVTEPLFLLCLIIPKVFRKSVNGYKEGVFYVHINTHCLKINDHILYKFFKMFCLMVTRYILDSGNKRASSRNFNINNSFCKFYVVNKFVNFTTFLTLCTGKDVQHHCWHDNSCKVLACFKSFFHSALFEANVSQFLMFSNTLLLWTLSI